MTQDTIRNKFYYKCGWLFYSKPSGLWGRIQPGTRAGTFDKTKGAGYYIVRVNDKNYLVHRLIFLFFHGYLPDRVDHIDEDTTNNRIENLRAATHSQNLCNRGKAKNNTSGFKGVCLVKKTGKWFAQIQVGKKQINIGSFHTPELAHEAYKAAALIHHKEFAHV